jgi:hypothetical protein
VSRAAVALLGLVLSKWKKSHSRGRLRRLEEVEQVDFVFTRRVCDFFHLLSTRPNNATAALPSEPVIQHPTGAPADRPTSHAPAPPRADRHSPSNPLQAPKPASNDVTEVPRTQPIQPPASQTTGSAQAAPGGSATGPASNSKSMFDFVSPFDVFEKPKPKTARNLSESPKPASTAGWPGSARETRYGVGWTPGSI